MASQRVAFEASGVQILLVPQEDFSEGELIQVGWMYQVSVDDKYFFASNFHTEGEAALAGKKRLLAYCQGLTKELQSRITTYEQIACDLGE